MLEKVRTPLKDIFNKLEDLFFEGPNANFKLGLALGTAAAGTYFVSSAVGMLGPITAGLIGGFIGSSVVLPFQLASGNAKLREMKKTARDLDMGKKEAITAPVYPESRPTREDLIIAYGQMGSGLLLSASATTATVLAAQKLIVG